jgi:hypothetical protein
MMCGENRDKLDAFFLGSNLQLGYVIRIDCSRLGRVLVDEEVHVVVITSADGDDLV